MLPLNVQGPSCPIQAGLPEFFASRKLPWWCWPVLWTSDPVGVMSFAASMGKVLGPRCFGDGQVFHVFAGWDLTTM